MFEQGTRAAGAGIQGGTAVSARTTQWLDADGDGRASAADLARLLTKLGLPLLQHNQELLAAALARGADAITLASLEAAVSESQASEPLVDADAVVWTAL